MGRTLTNDFSWSKSRHEKMAECLRSYYLTYYRSWGGWDAAAAEDVRALYVLKKLHNRFTWSGGMVHDTIRDALLQLRVRKDVNPTVLMARAHQQMQADYRFSKSKAYWKEKHRKNFAGLSEHEYQEPVTPEVWKKNWESVKAALDWFFASRFIPLAKSLRREQWLEVDETDFDKSVFYMEGVKIFAIPDFAYLESDGTPVVVDWKTGKSREGYDEQVLGYALYLQSRYGVDVEKVRTSLVYLNEGTEKTVELNAGALARFQDHFRTSVGRMRDLLVNADKNTPKDASAFPPASDLNACARCVYRRPCGREGIQAKVA